MIRLRNIRLVLFIVLGVVLVGVSAQTIKQLRYSRFEKNRYLSEKQVDFIRPGINLEITDIIVEGQQVKVAFKLTDDLGGPLDVKGIESPGPITTSFLLGVIPEGKTQYTSYINRTVTSPSTGVTAVQPTAESGILTSLGDGAYIHTFRAKLPADGDVNATHSVGIYARRDLTAYEGERIADDAVVHFTPAGGEVPFVRDITRTETCNKCHDELAEHGGARKSVELCVMCHTEGVIDPDTGNSVDFDVMVHKIHMGEHLPSVQAGHPYQIIGNANSVHDYSKVVFPQDLRNCATCHIEGTGQSYAHLLNPTRESCGSCHDDVNFATGLNHGDLPQISDNLCANCHIPQGELEFDASILGAHTIEAKSSQLEGIHIAIDSITHTTPGEFPVVRYKLFNDDNEPIIPSTLAGLTFLIAGPNTDFSYLRTESARTASIADGDFWTYTFTEAIPGSAIGSFTLGAEANRNVLLNAGTTNEVSFRETMDNNPYIAFAVTDAAPVPRRHVVEDAKCDACHDNLTLHGGNRHDPNYCVMCHTPVADDGRYRPAADLPTRSIDFKFLIHRIHRGEEMERDYTVIGFRGTPHNYNEVLYPGFLNNCGTCHVGNTFDVPSAGRLATTDLREYYSPMPPNSAACIGCHDTLDAAAHTWLNTAPFGESCAVCHGNGATFDVARVHAR